MIACAQKIDEVRITCASLKNARVHRNIHYVLSCAQKIDEVHMYELPVPS